MDGLESYLFPNFDTILVAHNYFRNVRFVQVRETESLWTLRSNAKALIYIQRPSRKLYILLSKAGLSTESASLVPHLVFI